jgi:hypothetical protein
MAGESEISLNAEEKTFVSADDQVALGDLAIRKSFARNIIWLFTGVNVIVLIGVGLIFNADCQQISARQIAPAQRIISSHVVMALIGATTVQLGTVVLTIAQAIFPRRTKEHLAR